MSPCLTAPKRPRRFRVRPWAPSQAPRAGFPSREAQGAIRREGVGIEKPGDGFRGCAKGVGFAGVRMGQRTFTLTEALLPTASENAILQLPAATEVTLY